MAPPGWAADASFSREAMERAARRSPRRCARPMDRGGRGQLVGGGARAEGRGPGILRRANVRRPAAAVRRRACRTATPQTWFSRGDYDDDGRGSRPLAATYYVAPSQHLGLEPLSATARFDGGGSRCGRRRRRPSRGHPRSAGARRVALSDAVGRAGGPRARSRCASRSRLSWRGRSARRCRSTLSQSSSQNHDRVAPARWRG